MTTTWDDWWSWSLSDGRQRTDDDDDDDDDDDGNNGWMVGCMDRLKSIVDHYLLLLWSEWSF